MMNVNKYLRYFVGGIRGALWSLSAALPVHAGTATDVPVGTHPTAVRIAESLPPPAAVELFPAKPVSDADLWQRVRRGFVLGELDTPLVQEHEQWYSSRPEYIQRFVDRGSKYLYHVVEEVERRGMPTEVALLPIIESAFNPQAYSRAKAAGMWQFIPSTGKNFGLKQDWMADNRRDVLLSTHAALDYLQKLYGMFNSWELAFAAYNCGEGCVARAIQKNARKGLSTDFLSLNLPPETRSYVPKLIAVKNIVLAPGSYGIELESMENRPYFSKVAAPAKIDVKLAARLAEMPEDGFAALNPAFNRPVASSGTGYFLVPADKADTFRENMDLYRSLDGPLVSWQTASAKRGESVDAVARRYGLTVSYLRATNGSLPEKKGKFTQPASFMVPMHKEAKIITATLDKKTALKASQPLAGSKAEPKAPEPPQETITVAASGIANVQPPAAVKADDPPAKVAAALPLLSAPVSTASAEPVPDSYRVQAGDTLFSIARRFGMTVDELKLQNRLSGNGLQVGQTLRIDPGQSGIATAPLMVRVRAPAATPRIYTVRAGDSLFAIALKFGVDLDDLMRWNKLTGRTVIQPGLKIRVTS
jgi:membrane-bound lytic murein transglycosylase D